MRVIIQARLGSTRLPGKIMAPLAGKPLLWHVVRRLESAAAWLSGPWEVWVATTQLPEDDLICDWCASHGVEVRRGPEVDVLSRYLLAAEDLDDSDVILRATADNPLYCPRRTAAIVAAHEAAGAGYTCIRDLSYVVPEVIRVGALRQMSKLALRPDDREHVTPYFREHTKAFQSQLLAPDWQGLRSDVRFTVDTATDLTRMQRLFDACARRGLLFSLEEAYRYLSTHDWEALVRAA